VDCQSVGCVEQRILLLSAPKALEGKKTSGSRLRSRLFTRPPAIEALLMAIRQRKPYRGSQYCGKEYQNLLNRHGLVCSMSRKGDLWDNAPMESIFHTLKGGLIHHRKYKARQEESLIFSTIWEHFIIPSAAAHLSDTCPRLSTS
jgi:hypothetical protein